MRIRALLLSACLAAGASSAAAAVLVVNEPWVRPGAKGGATEAFMQVTSSESAAIVDVRADVASSVALAGKPARAAPPFDLALPARVTVMLAPGGTRLALAGLRRALARGDRVAITLVVRYADGRTQEVAVDAEVRRRSPSEDHGVKVAR